MGHTIMERVLDPPKSPVQELPALGHSHHLLEPELLVSQMKILNKIDSRNLAASKGLVAELGNTFKAAPHCPLVASDYGPSKLRCPSIHPSIHLFFFPFKNTNRHSELLRMPKQMIYSPCLKSVGNSQNIDKIWDRPLGECHGDRWG